MDVEYVDIVKDSIPSSDQMIERIDQYLRNI